MERERAGALPEPGDLARAAVAVALERAAALGPEDLLTALDGTCGNGHDTLFLAGALHRLRPENSLVLAFDVQEQALATARRRLEAHGRAARLVRLVRAGHETLAAHLPPRAVLCAAMYNLGFLPGSDRLVVTRPETTLLSLRAVLERLRPGGACAVHAYGGHPGGLEELRALEVFFAGLPFDAFKVARYAFLNKPRNPETLFLAEKHR